MGRGGHLLIISATYSSASDDGCIRVGALETVKCLPDTIADAGGLAPDYSDSAPLAKRLGF